MLSLLTVIQNRDVIPRYSAGSSRASKFSGVLQVLEFGPFQGHEGSGKLRASRSKGRDMVRGENARDGSRK